MIERLIQACCVGAVTLALIALSEHSDKSSDGAIAIEADADQPAISLGVDDLLLKFVDNEIAANEEWTSHPIMVTGYIRRIEDGPTPELILGGSSDIDLNAEIADKSDAMDLKEGETVDLDCSGANRLYGITTAHGCVVSYHGKRRESDPYWPDPAAIQDKL